MIYFLSDLHGGKDADAFWRYVEEAREEDILILLGDLELSFSDTEENRRFTERFLSIRKRIAFIDGNHENHPYLRSFPETVAYGAPVHRLSEHIVHLKRGNVYTVEGHTFFVMGGCKSSQKWYDSGLVYEHEVPSEEELDLAWQSLGRVGNRVDYILTHKYPKAKDETVRHDPLDAFFYELERRVDYRHWYYGHWHADMEIDEKHTLVYQKPTALK